MKKTVAALIVALLLFGCLASSPPAPVPTVTATPSSTPSATATAAPTATPQEPPSDIVYSDFGEEFTLISGQRAVFNEGQVLFWYTNVSDSRCPTGVQCVWAGIVSIHANMQSGSAKAAFTLTQGQNATNVTLNQQSYSVTLESVTPYPEYPNRIPLSEYRATFIVSKA